MKFKIFSMLVVLGLLSVLPMIYMGKFDPMSYLDSSSGMTELQKLKAKAPQGVRPAVTDKKIQLYKWRDEHGVMQFSNTPPPENQAEMVELNPDHNVIQAVKIPVEEKKEEASNNMPNPYTYKGAKKTLNDAKGIQEMLDNRAEEQQKMIDNI